MFGDSGVSKGLLEAEVCGECGVVYAEELEVLGMGADMEELSGDRELYSLPNQCNSQCRGIITSASLTRASRLRVLFCAVKHFVPCGRALLARDDTILRRRHVLACVRMCFCAFACAFLYFKAFCYLRTRHAQAHTRTHARAPCNRY